MSEEYDIQGGYRPPVRAQGKIEAGDIPMFGDSTGETLVAGLAREEIVAKLAETLGPAIIDEVARVISTSIPIVDDSGTETGSKAALKAWYNTDDGELYLLAPTEA